MIKQKILAIIIPILFSINSLNAAEISNDNQNNIEIYGQIREQFDISKEKTGYSDLNGNQSNIQIGLKGESTVNNLIYSYGQLEYSIPTNKVEFGFKHENDISINNNLAFAGIKIPYLGSLDYGHNYGVINDALSWTNKLHFGSKFVQNNTIAGRMNGAFTYRNSDLFGFFDGLDIAAQYVQKSLFKTDRQDRYNDNGYGFSLTYITPFNMGFSFAYGMQKRRNEEATAAHPIIFGVGHRSEYWTTAFKYDTKPLYLALSYSQSLNGIYLEGITYHDGGYFAHGSITKARNVEAMIQYRFDFGLNASILYSRLEGYHIQNTVDDGNIPVGNDFKINTTFYFNKNAFVYAEIVLNKLHKNRDIETRLDNSFSTGIVYNF
ncbi:porin [Candidatus Tachikawaea gelatinosa]|uniref:Outer membrane protein F n=1 Tax=Candidatus Tachikawaea gelatinosa TaxID=1410383 RepID=A0A090BWJ9_9ENTR|nr:porin [Candidatus Tachikawaea gelatinosa]BAP58736.1 outer membrane protein F [Candidatus Tachikawaea gelatinosa]